MCQQKRKPVGYWTKGTVVTEIKKSLESGYSLTPSVIRHTHNSLYRNGLKYYGGWGAALEAAGEDINTWYKNKEGLWTRDKLRQELQRLAEEGVQVNYSWLVKNNPGLLSAIYKEYGNVEIALEGAGLDSKEHMLRNEKGYWSRGRVTERLQERKDAGKSLKPEDIRDEDGMLYDMIRKFYGDWELAYESIGEDINDYRLRRAYRAWETKEDVIREVINRRVDGLKVNAMEVHKEDISLYKQGLKYFGKWKYVLDAVGKEVRK